MPRQPATEETKNRMRAAHSGVPCSDATREKIRASNKARPRDEASIEKRRQACKAWHAKRRAEKELLASLDEEQRWAHFRKEHRKRHEAMWKARRKQWRVDLAIAREISEELFEDVRRSCGYWVRRRLHHPHVSDGYYQKRGKVMWKYPYKKSLREAAKKPAY